MEFDFIGRIGENPHVGRPKIDFIRGVGEMTVKVEKGIR